MIRKIIIFSFIIFFLYNCKKENAQNHENIDIRNIKQGKNVELNIYSLGVGFERETAKLNAESFLAQQTAGIKFTISNGKVSLNTKEVLLPEIIQSYYKRLNNGKLMYLIESKKRIKLIKQSKKIELVRSISLENFIDDRVNVLIKLLKDIYKNEINTSKMVKGKIYLSGILNITRQSKIPYDIKVKITIIE